MRKKMTLSQFNAALAREGMAMELVKGRGYFYFVTLDPLPYADESEYVYAFCHISPASWMARAREAWASLGRAAQGGAK